MSVAEPSAGRASNSLWFWGTMAAAIGWLLTIAVLAVLTANPVTINRAQILSSDAVVVGRVRHISAGGLATLAIERVLTGDDVPETIRLARTANVLAVDRTYLLPLRRVSTGWAITPAPARAEETYLVYPANDDVVRDVMELLKTEAPRPYP